MMSLVLGSAPADENFGMLDLWTLYQSGRCEEGKQTLAVNWPKYHQIIDSKGGPKAVASIRGMADKGYEVMAAAF